MEIHCHSTTWLIPSQMEWVSGWGPWVGYEGASQPGRGGRGGQALPPLPRLRASGQGVCWLQATEQAGVAAGFGEGKGAWVQQRQPNAQLPAPCAGSPLQLRCGQPAATSSLPVASLFACPLVFLHSPLFCSLSLFMCITLSHPLSLFVFFFLFPGLSICL